MFQAGRRTPPKYSGDSGYGSHPNGIPTGDGRESFLVLCLGWPAWASLSRVRKTLSKNELLPGLTYFYCNWVSQGRNMVRGWESEWRRRCRLFSRPPFGYPPRLRSGLRQNRAGFLEKREKWRTPLHLSTVSWQPRLQSIRRRCWQPANPHYDLSALDVGHPPRRTA